MSIKNPVRTLNPEVARKIAAGEVIDRPNAIIRELMDNSIDSGASDITVEITGGGIEKIRIIDNGCGMTKEDLQCCAKPHSTSKISDEVDLMNLTTLGFRGEALASIAAVTRLSIISGGWKMRASITEDHILEQTAETKGTIVQAEGLFENFPARRQFLKRPGTEALMCKNTFIEKAVARPDIRFRFIQDGAIKIDLPANQTLAERFVMSNGYKENINLFYEFGSSSTENDNETPQWSFKVVIGEPSVSRSNKKEIFIYTNGRHIQEYSLVQAVEYGGQGYFPNGTYPVAAVFIQIRPDLVDFNIHPAKKEARFFDIAPIHHGLSSTIKSFFLKYTKQNVENNENPDEININEFDFTPSDAVFEIPVKEPVISEENKKEEIENIAIQKDDSSLNNKMESFKTADNSVKENTNLDKLGYFSHSGRNISYKNDDSPSKDISDFRSKYLNYDKRQNNSDYSQKGSYSAPKHHSFISTKSLADQALEAQNNVPAIKTKVRYIGDCLGTFLLAEKDNCLYIIDQHAAHERILFDKLMNTQSKAKSQKLLIPYKINTESRTQDKLMEKLSSELDRIGFENENKGNGLWEITSIPERWTGTEYELRNLIFVKQVEPKEIIRSIAAMTACKSAIKDGYKIDRITAQELIEEAFKLDDPHCPHGRPIYTVISREKLFQLVKRT